MDLNPRLTLPWRLGDYLYGFGTLGLRETIYDTYGHQIQVIPVGTDWAFVEQRVSCRPSGRGWFPSCGELIYGNAGVSSEIEKVYDVNWETVQKIKHTIEPFVTYAYVPNINQGRLPLFDETDRVEGRSLFLYGATSRIFLKLPPEQPTVHQESEQLATAEDQDEGALHPFRSNVYSNGSDRGGAAIHCDAGLRHLHVVAQGSSHASDVI